LACKVICRLFFKNKGSFLDNCIDIQEDTGYNRLIENKEGFKMKVSQIHSAHHPETDASLVVEIEVTYYFVQKPLGRNADSDADCYGYTDIEFDIVRIFDEDDQVECPLDLFSDSYIEDVLRVKAIEEMEKE
jgi:hypothetical protein